MTCLAQQKRVHQASILTYITYIFDNLLCTNCSFSKISTTIAQYSHPPILFLKCFFLPRLKYSFIEYFLHISIRSNAIWVNIESMLTAKDVSRAISFF